MIKRDGTGQNSVGEDVRKRDGRLHGKARQGKVEDERKKAEHGLIRQLVRG